MTAWTRSRATNPAAQGLYKEIRGQSGETVVFIPGLGGTTRYWASRVQAMQQRYRVVLVDALGFGESPKPWTRYSVERHVDALHDALADLGPLSLVGHSLGALLSVAYAARHPWQVDNLALIAMPVFGSQRGAYRYLRKGPVRGGYIYTNVLLTIAACILTRRLLGRLLPYLLRSLPREVAADLVKHTWRSSSSSLWEVVYRYDVVQDIARLPERVDVLCIHGNQDAMAPVAAIEALAASKPHWRLRIFRGVDHHPFLREPQACLALIGALVGPAGAVEARVPAQEQSRTDGDWCPAQ